MRGSNWSDIGIAARPGRPDDRRRSSVLTRSGTSAFFNQPFAIMAQLEPEWLAEQPEFDRIPERMREHGRLPEVRDFPAPESGAAGPVHFRRRNDRGGLDTRQWRPPAHPGPADARRRPAPDL